MAWSCHTCPKSFKKGGDQILPCSNTVCRICRLQQPDDPNKEKSQSREEEEQQQKEVVREKYPFKMKQCIKKL